MNLFRNLLLSLASCCALTGLSARDADYRIASPDGQLTVLVRASDSLTYTVSRRGETLLEPSTLALRFAEETIPARGARILAAERTSVDRTVPAPFHRQSEVAERYNQLRLVYDGGYAVAFRVFDTGCAYRFETAFCGERTVAGEIAEFRLAGDPELYAACADGMCNAFQFCYESCRASEFRTDKPVLLPLAADWGEGRCKALLCESDLESYPGMFLAPGDGGVLRGVFAAMPDSCYLHERRCQQKVVTRHDYIAHTAGTRTYPWRILAVADRASELPTNDLVYALGAECRVDDCSWIKPGKVAWEWWNNWGLTHVDFKPGIDTRTYKAYIDFAADYGLEYVVLDEGWSDPKLGDVMSVIPAIDLPELVRYAGERGVGLILWAVANVLDEKLEQACAHYAAMGIKGFKVDFIDRDDQLAVELVYRLAAATAAHRLTLDIHGVYKPTGLNRTYPNILNFEGVFGLEELKWSNPDMPSYDVTFPFIRMVQGPVDYTPGAFRNATREGFEIDYYHPMSQGTRAHQAAAYVVFDMPLAMLCDSPSHYIEDEACTRFIASLPTAYDHTRVLSGQIARYIVTARRKGDCWYVGGMTDWMPRTLEVDCSFLEPGRKYRLMMLADDKRSAEEPERYALDERTVTSKSRLRIPAAPGGGFALRIVPAEKR